MIDAAKFQALDLFSGIGGLALGLEMSGEFQTSAFCEINSYCRRVLAKHWPKVPCYDDVRSIGAERLRADGITIDAIAGGFPCQDISWAGNGAGIVGDRSGLWSEYARLVGELRPAIIVVENVAALLERGMGVVLGDLSSLGYDAEWSTVSACSVGAPHMRQRVFIVAYANSIDGRARLRYPSPHKNRTLQTVDRFTSSRARFRARLENPSELYGGADGLPYGMDRNRGIGNAVAPEVGNTIGLLIAAARESITKEAA